MKQKICAFSIADNKNLPYFKMMAASFKKFHPDIPLILCGEEEINNYNDKDFFYRATPILASKLIKEYETVIKLDADQIIAGDLNNALEGDYDIAVVNNSNPRELKKIKVNVWDINPLAYVNCGLVIMKSERLINHWLKLCRSEFFGGYQYREQDLLNIVDFYGDYKVRFLDQEDSYYGLASKGYWNEVIIKDDKLVLPKGEEWPDRDKIVRVVHSAGGNDPAKMNLRPYFKPEVIKYLEGIVGGQI